MSGTASESSGSWSDRLLKARWSSAAAAWLIVVTIGAAVWNLAANDRSDAAIARYNDLSTRGDAILSNMKDLETGERGFLLTGNETYLEPYRAADERLRSLLLRLQSDVSVGGARPRLLEAVNLKRNIAARAIEATL